MAAYNRAEYEIEKYLKQGQKQRLKYSTTSNFSTIQSDTVVIMMACHL